MAQPVKRSAEDAGLDAPGVKHGKSEEPSVEKPIDLTEKPVEKSVEVSVTPDAADIGDEFDDLLRAGSLDASLERYDSLADEPPPVELPEEVARRSFADRVCANLRVDAEELPDLISELQSEAPKWGSIRRVRSAALLFVIVARSTRICRAAFVAEGLQLLGSVLQEGVLTLEKGDAQERQEAGMWILACLTLLRALPIGRATMWQHRVALGKPFDRLHKWCSRERSALAAELRGPTTHLCTRWKKQPKPAEQDADPTTKAVRRKVVDLIAQGLAGIPGGPHSPASPAVPASPAARLPADTTALELEAALFSRYSGATAEYRQHARMLRSNLALPGNTSLRESVLSGDTSAEELLAMNSSSIAPESLQEERLRKQKEALKGITIKEKLMPPPDMEDGRTDYNPATAPPLLEKRLSSIDREEGAASLARRDSSDLAAPAAEPAGSSGNPTTFRMEPPPTPFREAEGTASTTASSGGGSPGGTPDVSATPAQGEEDEDERALIQWLTRPVRGGS